MAEVLAEALGGISGWWLLAGGRIYSPDEKRPDNRRQAGQGIDGHTLASIAAIGNLVRSETRLYRIEEK